MVGIKDTVKTVKLSKGLLTVGSLYPKLLFTFKVQI